MIFKHQKHCKSIFLGLLMAGFFYAWTGNAQAEDMGPSIAVVPHTFDLSVEKGEKINDRIRVYNRGKFAIPFKIRIVDFGAVEETGEMTMIDSSDSSLSSVGWFEFEKQDFMVDPGQKEELKFSINIPQDAKPQGYYAMLLIEADISTHLFNESKLQVIPNMGVIFMLKVEGGEQANEPLTILEYSVLDEHRLVGIEKVANFLAKPIVSDSGHVNVIKSEQPAFMVKIKNNDPYHKKLSGNIKLSGVGWKLEDELEVQPMTILPGMTRKILVKGATRENEQENEQDKKEEQLDKEGSFGFMQANLKIEEEQGFIEEQKQWIIVFSWKMAALFLLAIVCIIVPICIVRKKTLLRQGFPLRYLLRHLLRQGYEGQEGYEGQGGYEGQERKKVKPKPKFKKHALGVVEKAERKIPDDVGAETAGSENVQSKKIKETATKRTRKGSPRTKQQTRKTVTRKPARKKVLKGKDKKTSQRKTRRSSKTAKTRRRKTAKKKVAAGKSPAKKSARRRTRKSSPKTKQQKRKALAKRKRAATPKKRAKQARRKPRTRKTTASRKQKKTRKIGRKKVVKKI